MGRAIIPFTQVPRDAKVALTLFYFNNKQTNRGLNTLCPAALQNLEGVLGSESCESAPLESKMKIKDLKALGVVWVHCPP